jgi:hypothetical protein
MDYSTYRSAPAPDERHKDGCERQTCQGKAATARSITTVSAAPVIPTDHP